VWQNQLLPRIVDALHTELEQFIAAIKNLTATAPHPRHYVTNILTEVNGTEARCRCFLLMTSTTKEGGSNIAAAGEYEDRLVKIDGQWLFRERIVRVDGA